MKLYITKPKHTRYGSIKMEPYTSIDDFYNDCTVWFIKPKFQKPQLCMFTDELVWYGFEGDYHSSGIHFKYLLEQDSLIAVNNQIKELVLSTLNDDFTDKLKYRHHHWIGIIDVDITLFNPKEHTDYLSLFFIKPSVGCIQVAGLDRCEVFLSKPHLKREYYINDDKYYYRLTTNKSDVLSGKLFRKVPELDDIGTLMWQAVKDSFQVDSSDMNYFYYNISNKNHKKGQSSKQFFREFKIKISIQSKEN